jgi:hypothetical protein
VRFATHGQAYRDAQLVAAEVLVEEQVETSPIPVTLPGGRIGHKPNYIRRPSWIRFESIDDELLYRELSELIAGACDLQKAREQRDRGWAPRPLDLVLDYERNVTGCRLGRPFEAIAVAPEATRFPIQHTAL